MDVGVNKNLQKARQAMAAGKHAEALRLYAQVARHFPQGGGEFGRAAADAGDFDLADRVWEKFLSQPAVPAGLLARLAEEYQTLGMHRKARALLGRAAELEPRNVEIQVKRAALLCRTSSVDEARPAAQRCLELDGRNEQGRYLTAHLDRRAGRLVEAERQFRDFIKDGARDASVAYSCRAELAAILDRTDRPGDAMAVLAEAKQLARQSFKLEAERKSFYERHEAEVRQAVALPRNILAQWSHSFPPRARNAVAPPAFLSGVARSGTTLLERVLDAHPAVAACDEAPAFKAVLPHIDVTAPAVPAQRLNVLRERYVKNLLKALEAPGAGKILLDKNPSRTVWLPALLRAFPDLRVIIALRDPRDVIVSLYFQDHARTNYLTFEELAAHYKSVMDVWLAARQWDGLTWMETRYEDTVAGLEKEGGRVTTFLGLEWDANQARFYERNREKPVLSTNYGDVTQPVYARSVGRWRVYEKYLAPILPTLDPYVRAFGYA